MVEAEEIAAVVEIVTAEEIVIVSRRKGTIWTFYI